MKPEIKEKITATNQKYLKKFLTEEVPAKLESQLRASLSTWTGHTLI